MGCPPASGRAQIDEMLEGHAAIGTPHCRGWTRRVTDGKKRVDRNVGSASRRCDAETIHVRRLINCTGPARDVSIGSSKLLRSLIAGGIGRPGPLALGLEVSDSGALIDRMAASKSESSPSAHCLKNGYGKRRLYVNYEPRR